MLERERERDPFYQVHQGNKSRLLKFDTTIKVIIIFKVCSYLYLLNQILNVRICDLGKNDSFSLESRATWGENIEETVLRWACATKPKRDQFNLLVPHLEGNTLIL